MKYNNGLLEQKSALGAYLDDMLHEATTTEVSPEIEPAQTLEGADLSEELLQNFQSDIEEIFQRKSPVVNEPPGPPASDLETAAEVETVGVCDETSLTREMFPLQSLMFKVGNNLLAVPLTELHSVVEWKDKLTRLPGEPDWVLGVLKCRDDNVCVIDSAAVLQIKRDSKTSSGYILVLGDGQWGITCDRIDTVVTLNYDDIQWHTRQLDNLTYGTIRDSLASFLNPTGLIRSLLPGQISTNEKTA